jgi:hypothetical protein
MKSFWGSGYMKVFIGLAALVTLALSSPSFSESLIADAVYLNGKILTANDRFEIVQALAVKDGRIIALGPNAKVRGLAGKNTRIVDLKGDTVLPGLYDNHIHFGEAVQLVILIGFAVAYVSFHHAYISVWCFFAAIASVLVYLYVRSVPANAALEGAR